MHCHHPWMTGLVLGVPLAVATGDAGAGGTGRADFYVAPQGNDRWSGTRATPNRQGTDGPFATLERAREAIRHRQAAGKRRKPWTVMVRGGTYSLAQPFILKPEDSGTAEGPITYTAYPGEKPVFSGGRRIGGWKRGEGPLWTAIKRE
jgi:hypothetical protein